MGRHRLRAHLRRLPAARRPRRGPAGAPPHPDGRPVRVHRGLATARRRYDPFGAVTVTGGLSLLVYAVSTAPRVGWGTARTVTLLAVSAALLAAFVVIETRVEAPLMPLRIFQNKTLAGANAVSALPGGDFFP